MQCPAWSDLLPATVNPSYAPFSGRYVKTGFKEYFEGQTEETSLTIVPHKEMWVPQAMLLATVAVLMGYSAYCNYLS